MSIDKNILLNYPNFFYIETGTGLGDSLNLALQCDFEVLYSIELSNKIFQIAKKRFWRYDNVVLLHGDSTEVLRILLQTIDAPATFFLDAHYCGAFTDGTISGFNNKNEVTVYKELEIIKEHPVKNHTIIIDDMGTYGSVGLTSLIFEINPDYKIHFVDGTQKNDILIATL